MERLTLVAPAPFTPKVYTIAEVLALWPEGARPTEKRLRPLARRIGPAVSAAVR